MPSSKAKLTDIIAQLGLRGPYTQRAEDYKLCAAVEEMYKTAIPELCRAHYRMPMPDIKKSPEVMDASARLLKLYGPTIWSDTAERPWLLVAGDGATGALYDEERFYSDPDDFRFLGDRLYTLVVAKILRWRKDNIRNSSVTPDARTDEDWQDAPDQSRDATYSPAASSKKRASISNSKPRMRCFAHLTRGYGGHEDARNLEKLRVWLGDWKEEQVTINGLSQNGVEEAYFEQTLGGKECSRAEPVVHDECVQTELTVECAACKATGTSCETMKLIMTDFEWEVNKNDPENYAGFTKFAWTFRCKLNDSEENVFAYVKKLSDRESIRLGSDTPLWSFWLLDGGYTTEYFLTTVANDDEATSQPKALEKGKRKADDGGAGPSTARVTRQRVSTNGGRARTPEEIAFRPIDALINATRSRGSPETIVREDDQDDEEEIVQRTQAHIASPALQARRPSFDSMYDITPRPEGRRIQENSERLEQPARTTDDVTVPQAVQEVQRGEAASATPAAATAPMRFDIWFTFEGIAGKASRVVILDDSMSFEDAFARIKQKLGRKLEGKTLLALFLRFDEETQLEVDESDTWTLVLEMVRKTKKTRLDGTLELE